MQPHMLRFITILLSDRTALCNTLDMVQHWHANGGLIQLTSYLEANALYAVSGASYTADRTASRNLYHPIRHPKPDYLAVGFAKSHKCMHSCLHVKKVSCYQFLCPTMFACSVEHLMPCVAPSTGAQGWTAWLALPWLTYRCNSVIPIPIQPFQQLRICRCRCCLETS